MENGGVDGLEFEQSSGDRSGPGLSQKNNKAKGGGENKTKSYNAEFREVMDTKCIQMTRLEWQSTEGFVEN
jgi:hypothetical protein